MSKVLVLVPTFNHSDTLRFSLTSALDQTHTDFELVVIGDGAPPETKALVAEFSAKDSRIRFEGFSKSLRTGEPYRDQIIRDSDADIVAYLGDDDLWTPWHLKQMVAALERADLVHSPHVLVGLDGGLQTFMFNPRAMILREHMSKTRIQCFGLTFAAHRRQSYLKLHSGWETTPPGTNTDVFMWSRWAAEQALDLRVSPLPSALHFHSVLRRRWDAGQRVAELRQWSPRVRKWTSVADLGEQCHWDEYFERVLRHQLPRSCSDLDSALGALGIAVKPAENSSAATFPLDPQEQQDLETLWQSDHMRISKRRAARYWRQRAEDGKLSACLHGILLSSNESAARPWLEAAAIGGHGRLAQLFVWLHQRNRVSSRLAELVNEVVPGSRKCLSWFGQ